MALRRGVRSLSLRSAAATFLRRHLPPPLEPLPLAAPPCRSFAAPPPQGNRKAKEKDDDSAGPRINNAITYPFLRLVTDQGHNVVPRHDALRLAQRMGMDLVEVDRKSDPPVCKIMDFHKEKFKKETKEKERLKSKSAIVLRGGENKEVRFKAKTELKDLMVKADAITRLMERGYRVKCMAMPSGNDGEDLGGPLSRLLGLIQDVCIVESGPHLDSKHAYVIIRHVKFVTKKGGKKASKAMEDAGKGTCVTISESLVAGNDNEDEKIECGSGGDDWRAMSDPVDKTATHLHRDSSARKEGQVRGFQRESNGSKSNQGAGREKLYNANAGQWERSIDSPEMERRENNMLYQESSATNGYATQGPPIRDSRGYGHGRLAQDRRNETEGHYMMNDNHRPLEQHNRPFPPRFNQGRLPQDPRNENRYGMNDNQRPLEQHNRPFPPRLNQGRLPQDSINERRDHFPSNNNQRQAAGVHLGNPNGTTKSFGIFSNPKPASSESRKTDGACGSKPVNTVPKSYGIFSSKRESDSKG